MNNDNYSIKQKLIFAFVLVVVLSTGLLGWLSKRSSETLIKDRLTEVELPQLMGRMADKIDSEITSISMAAESLASDPFLLDWLAQGASKEGEKLLLAKLNKMNAQIGVTTSSFANRDDGRYWNQEGFLRVLDRNSGADSWFFAYTESGKARSSSLYTEPDGGSTKLFVNFQQVNGVGMAGLAKSVGNWTKDLLSDRIGETGFAYVVDGAGNIILHRERELINNASLKSLYGKEVESMLSQRKTFAFSEFNDQSKTFIISSVYIDSIDWYVVAQVPAEEIFAAFNTMQNELTFWALVVTACVAGLSIFLANSIVGPIRKIASLFLELGGGDAQLSVRLGPQVHRELTELTQGFNDFVSKIEKTVEEVNSTSGHLNQQAQLMAGSVNQALCKGQDQLDLTTQVATAIHQMESTVSEVASNAASAASTADDVEKAVNDGREVVEKVKSMMASLAGDVDAGADSVESLASQSVSIGSIIQVIESISDQTNLLALNAAIEAARAGEYGRGFAVVADEVRQLAQRTKDSTSEIQQLIMQLQQKAEATATTMAQSQSNAQNSVANAEQANEALDRIVEGVYSLKELNHLVAVATEEQASTAQEINKNVSQIDSSSRDNLETSKHLNEVSQKLNELSTQLDTTVSVF